MTVRDVATTGQRLTEAMEIGRRIAAIRREAGLWSLSEKSWRRQAFDLGDFVRSVPESWEALARFPYLLQAIEVRARLWCDHGQDRPAVFAFGGERDPLAHAEMMALGWPQETLSALAALRCADMRNEFGHTWGKADNLDPADGDLALAPHEAELTTLDRLLAGTVLLSMATCRDGRVVIEHAGLVVPVGNYTVRHLATSFAQAAALRVERPAELVPAAEPVLEPA